MKLNVKLIQNVTFKLKSDPNLIEDYYIILKKQDPQLNSNLDDIEIKQQMQLDNNTKIYQTTIEVQTKITYKYQYSKKIHDNIIYEFGFRGFQQNQDNPLKVDEWNKQWYKYTFNYGGYKPNIFNGYQPVIRIRDYDSNLQEEIIFEKNSKYSMHCEEIIDLNKKNNNRQLCFNQINYDGKKLNTSEPASIIDVNNNKYAQIIDFNNNKNNNKVDKFISNLALIEFKEIDTNIKQRIETYSAIYDEIIIMKQQLNNLNQSKDLKQNIQEGRNQYDNKIIEINQQHSLDLMRKDQITQQVIIDLEQKQKDQMEQFIKNNQQQFEQYQIKIKDYSKIQNQYYFNYCIDQNEKANQKFIELEFSKVNFQSEEIKIQVEDFNQLSKQEQEDLKQLQEKLNIYESKIQEMKEENDYCSEKLEKKQLQFQGCQRSMNELKKCQQLLEKCEKDSLLLKKVNQIEKDQIEKKSSIYQTKLKEIQGKLIKKEQELVNFMDAIKEFEKKYQEEYMQNKKQNEEYQLQTQHYIQQLKLKQNEKMNQLITQNNSILEQNNLSFQKKFNDASQQEKINLNRIIDLKSTIIYEKLRNEVNPKNFRQQSIQNSYQQFNQIIENIFNLITSLQQDIIKNLKNLGLQIIEDLQKKYINQHALVDLINENFLMQICKLIVIISEISENQQSIKLVQQDISHIENIKQLQNQLYENVNIIMIKKYDQNILPNNKRNRFFFITVKIVLTFLYYFLIQKGLSV